MRTFTIAGIVAAALLLAGCARQEEQWQTATGSPGPGVQSAAYRASASSADKGQLRGCLSGANESFTLVEEGTATVYRLQASDDAEATPSAREVFQDLRLHDGKVVEVAGAMVRDTVAPGFEVRSVTTLADRCPADLMGAVNEFNRPSATRLNLTRAGSLGAIRGSMRLTRPPVAILPVNPAR